jgi:hypothetical protein
MRKEIVMACQLPPEWKHPPFEGDDIMCRPTEYPPYDAHDTMNLTPDEMKSVQNEIRFWDLVLTPYDVWDNEYNRGPQINNLFVQRNHDHAQYHTARGSQYEG